MQNPTTRRRFQFSLRTFLIVVCVLGVGGGLLGRLLLRYPEYLVVVLRLLTSVVPFLLAILTIVVLGARRRSAWSAPSCAACGHDLRRSDPSQLANCPQCDADLSGHKAVSFVGGRGRRWGLVAWAGVLLVTPVLGAVGWTIVARLVGPSPGGLGMVPTPQLLTQRLPSQIEQPWVWNELERRPTVIKTAPMLGLFGTVLGMMGAFKTLATAENVKPELLAGDISFALVTTAIGLTIAIPLILATASVNVRIRKLEDLVAAGLTRFLETFRSGLGGADRGRGN